MDYSDHSNTIGVKNNNPYSISLLHSKPGAVRQNAPLGQEYSHPIFVSSKSPKNRSLENNRIDFFIASFYFVQLIGFPKEIQITFTRWRYIRTMRDFLTHCVKILIHCTEAFWSFLVKISFDLLAKFTNGIYKRLLCQKIRTLSKQF